MYSNMFYLWSSFFDIGLKGQFRARYFHNLCAKLGQIFAGCRWQGISLQVMEINLMVMRFKHLKQIPWKDRDKIKYKAREGDGKHE